MMKFLAIDSSLSNTGVAIGYYGRGVSGEFEIAIEEIRLSQNQKSTAKQVRVSSDTIVRCRETLEFVHGMIKEVKPNIVCVETPQGSQSANGMKSYGTTCMLIASLVPPAIEVTAMEVKLASVGSKTASKEDMIQWAHKKYPHLNWLMHAGKLQAKNEHCADAIGIIYATIKTAEFKRLLTLNA